MKTFLFTVIFILASFSCLAQDSKQETLTNERIIDMVKKRFTVETIIADIQTSVSVNFDTTHNALDKLKRAGVNEKIIREMMKRGRSTSVKTVNSGEGIVSKEPSNVAPIKKPDATSKEQPKKFSAKAKFFTFDLDLCKVSGERIVCDVMITNNDESSHRVIQFGYAYYISTMIDDKGNMHKAAQSLLANQDGTDRMSLASGVPVSGRVVFNEIQNQPNIIKLLTLSFNAPDALSRSRINNFKVEFRNVPVKQ